MLKLGLTGGIGSGKSSVAIAFEALGYPVYYSDNEAKRLMVGQLRCQIETLLGFDAFLPDGKLNKPYISKLIFTNPSLLKQINGIVHPAVEEEFNAWANRQEAPLVVEESAILIESNAYKVVDKIVVVTAPLNVRIERTMKRDNLTQQQVQAKIDNQLNDSALLSFADFVIDTHADFITPQVVEIVKKLLPLQQ